VPRYHLSFVGRRELLVWMGATGATSALAACTSSPALPTAQPTAPSLNAPPPKPAPVTPPYFSSQERSILNALADAVLPPDDTPGGSELGAVDYVENLLTAFDPSTPFVFSGGPYSGREPIPNADGSASSSYPDDGFANFLPLDRVATRAWMLRIYGSSGVPGGGPNDAITGPGSTGPVVGLRAAVASALEQAAKAAPKNVALDALSAEQQAALLAALDATTQGTIIELVLEGSFTSPEYGGNKDLAGWKLANFEGDSQPYGYSTYDTTTGKYIDHPKNPCASANPGVDPMPMTPQTETLVGLAFVVLGGKAFG
jgi:hypothetical protein